MSQDLHVFSDSMSNSSGESIPVPFLKKEMLYQIDNNGSTNYSRNQLQFETTAWSNSGKWADFKNGFISIPLVMTSTRNADNHFASADAQQLLQMKGSNLSIIDSIQIEMNNNTVIQQTRNIAPLFNFKKHTTLGLNDVELHGHTMGYQKHSVEDWSYVAEEGLHNNTSMDHKFYHKVKGDGDVQNFADLKASGANCQEASDAATPLVHTFYYDCIIRLKDLPFFEKMPMVRGALMKITLTLNQGDVDIKVVASKKTKVTPSLSGSFMPVIRKAGGEVADYEEKLSVKVVTNGASSHTKSQCRLYAPAYTFAPEMESQYLSLGSKKVLFTDVYHQRIRNVSGGFSTLLTNSLSRMKRLIICPVLSSSGNGTLAVEPQASPFCPDGVATCSPYHLSNFNVALSGSNIYQNSITYKYEQFLNEMAGSQGVNAGLEDGVSSGLISLKDFESNYGYIVVSLDRRHKFDDNTPLSVQVTGTVASAKPLDLLCYIEYEKDVEISVETGQVL